MTDLVIQRGDLVRINFDHCPDESEFSARVLFVKHRYGCYEHGGEKVGPLITYKRIDNDHIDDKNLHKLCDQKFVTRIIARRDELPIRSRLLQDISVDTSRVFHMRYGGNKDNSKVRVGSFSMIAMEQALPNIVGHNYPTERIDVKKAKRKWEKDSHPGVKSTSAGMYVVNKKRFDKWLKQNLNRFLMTVKEADYHATEGHEEENRIIHEMMIEDLEMAI